jgi:transcriptional regulator GlxA family with amidase domain
MPLHVPRSPELNWLFQNAETAPHVTSVCTGAFALAKAALLDGHRATAHWNATAELRKRFSKSSSRTTLFINDGHVWTSTGVMASVDLAFALVEQDLGREITFEIARILCVAVQRPGGQSWLSSNISMASIIRVVSNRPSAGRGHWLSNVWLLT